MKNKLKNSGLKQTPQRLAILDFLKGNKNHPSVEDIYKSISKQFPTISLATVYNNLETLKQLGIIKELTIDPQKKHFDPNVSPHHHIICIDCGQIVDVNINYELKVPDENKCGFEITGNHIEFYGICPDCKNKSNSHN